MPKIPEGFTYKSGPRAVLLLHNFAGSVASVKRLARYINKAGYTTKAINFTGHKTGLIEDYLKADSSQWIQDAYMGLSELNKSGYNEIAVFGLSLGGAIATHLLSEDSSLLGGGCFSSPITALDLGETGVPDSFLRYANHQVNSRSDLTVDDLVDIEEELKFSLDDINQLNHEVYKNLSKLSKPYFVAAGAKDQLISPELLDELAKQASKYTQVTFKKYQNSGHYISAGLEASKLADDIIFFLDCLEWSK